MPLILYKKIFILKKLEEKKHKIKFHLKQYKINLRICQNCVAFDHTNPNFKLRQIEKILLES